MPLDCFPMRAVQRDYAARIADALRAGADQPGRFVFLEAETGVGKTIGYLVPTLIDAMTTGSRVVVATNTLALQRQIAEEEIPRIADAIAARVGRAPFVVIRQARSRFASPRRCRKYAQARRDENARARLNEPDVIADALDCLANFTETRTATAKTWLDALDATIDAWREAYPDAADALDEIDPKNYRLEREKNRTPETEREDAIWALANADIGQADLVLTTHASGLIDLRYGGQLLHRGADGSKPVSAYVFDEGDLIGAAGKSLDDVRLSLDALADHAAALKDFADEQDDLENLVDGFMTRLHALSDAVLAWRDNPETPKKRNPKTGDEMAFVIDETYYGQWKAFVATARRLVEKARDADATRDGAESFARLVETLRNRYPDYEQDGAAIDLNAEMGDVDDGWRRRGYAGWREILDMIPRAAREMALWSAPPAEIVREIDALADRADRLRDCLAGWAPLLDRLVRDVSALEQAAERIVDPVAIEAASDLRAAAIGLSWLNRSIRFALRTGGFVGHPIVTCSPTRNAINLVLTTRRNARIVSKLSGKKGAKLVVVTSATLSNPARESVREMFKDIAHDLDVDGVKVDKVMHDKGVVAWDLCSRFEVNRFGKLAFALARPDAPKPTDNEGLSDVSKDWAEQVVTAVKFADRWDDPNGNRRTLILATGHDAAAFIGAALTREFGDRVIIRYPESRRLDLIAAYEARDDAILIGAGFWHGINLPGLVKRLVIPRLPFAPPDASMSYFENLRQMREKFRQGIGRAIRRPDDAAMILITDPRVGLPNKVLTRNGLAPFDGKTFGCLDMIQKRFRPALSQAMLIPLPEATKKKDRKTGQRPKMLEAVE